MTKKKKTGKGGGGKLSRSEIVQVRLDPKLKFAAELAAKIQRRTLSSFIEWCVSENSLKVEIDPSKNKSVFDALEDVWAPTEVVRFLKLATQYPGLLTYDEERLFELIVRHEGSWITVHDADPHNKRSIKKNPEAMQLEFLNKFFRPFKDVINGKLEEKTLGCMIERAKEKEDIEFFNSFGNTPWDESAKDYYKKNNLTLKQLDQLLEDYGY